MAARFGRAARKQPEGVITSACIAWLCAHGCDVIRNNTGSTMMEYTTKVGERRKYRVRFGKKGSGDILACGPGGRWIEVETKTAAGVISPEQHARRTEIERRGGLYVLARSLDDLEAVKGELVK